MGTIQLPDINLAVINFLKHFESLSRLPLITDSEMDRLFGEEVSLVLQELERYNQQEEMCHTCRSRCCLLVDCELYVPEFSRCSIHKFRPLLCRMHYCNRFAPVYKELVKTIGDVFLESLLAGEKVHSGKTKLLDSPPLGRLVPALVDAASQVIVAFKAGCLNEAEALKGIISAAEKC